jgi:uncharacterized protein YodC (DUF2158 family)
MTETKFNVHDSVRHIETNQKMMVDEVCMELPKLGDTHQTPTGYYYCVWLEQKATVATRVKYHEDELVLISKA